MSSPADLVVLAGNVGALLAELHGDADDLRELEQRRNRLRDEGDEEAAERCLARVAELALVHSVAANLLRVFESSLHLDSPALAKAAVSGIQCLVRMTLANEAPGEDEP